MHAYDEGRSHATAHVRRLFRLNPYQGVRKAKAWDQGAAAAIKELATAVQRAVR